MHQSPRGVRRGKQQRRGVEHKIALVAESLCNRRTHPDHGNDHKAEHRHLMVDRTRHALTSPLLSRLESKSLHFLNYTALLSIKQTFLQNHAEKEGEFFILSLNYFSSIFVHPPRFFDFFLLFRQWIFTCFSAILIAKSPLSMR